MAGMVSATVCTWFGRADCRTHLALLAVVAARPPRDERIAGAVTRVTIASPNLTVFDDSRIRFTTVYHL